MTCDEDRSRHARWRQRHDAGPEGGAADVPLSLFGIYGLTETTGAITQLDPGDHDPGGPREHLLRSAGRPYPWVEMRIADPRTGGQRASGEPGEVWLRAPNVMAGYFDRPAETAAALTEDGWLRTGAQA